MEFRSRTGKKFALRSSSPSAGSFSQQPGLVGEHKTFENSGTDQAQEMSPCPQCSAGPSTALILAFVRSHREYCGCPSIHPSIHPPTHPLTHPSEPIAAAMGLHHVAVQGSWLLSGHCLSRHSCWELSSGRKMT